MLGAVFEPVDITELAPPENDGVSGAVTVASTPAAAAPLDDGGETYYLDGDELDREE